ncbi:MAG: hypothetical protein KDD45_12615, partial [Bdellovibrionales bacterium]|nr:hypothetical protein [Bdellovibrionales bacterium]
IEPFNIKVLMHTLQFLLRESPTLAPWIAKFKCKKLILNVLKQEPNRAELTEYVFSLLNKYGEKGDNISELGFLQVLLRLASPFLLNTISGLVF